jgi:hypothetical protein
MNFKQTTLQEQAQKLQLSIQMLSQNTSVQM